VEAQTGQALWTHECQGEFYASPLVADGKVFVGTRRGDFWVLEAGREKRVLARVDFRQPISASATAANGVLYVATMTHLYALEQGRAGASRSHSTIENRKSTIP
jgi:outer membrane protein assembly factor BamB